MSRMVDALIEFRLDRKRGSLGSETQQRGKYMKDMISQLHEWIKLVSQVGIGLIALGVIVEIVFGTGAIFGVASSRTLHRL